MQHTPTTRHPIVGFTLAEVAVVMAIIALLLGGLLSALPNHMRQKQIQETEASLQTLREALMGHALSHGHLPCPDINLDGEEDLALLSQCHRSPADVRCASTDGNATPGQPSDLANQQVCAAQTGQAPHVTLAAEGHDAWRNRISYRVEPAFSNHSVPMLLSSTGSLQLCDNTGCNRAQARGVPALLISHGANGLGATSASGTRNPPPTGEDELANTDGDLVFVHHEPRGTGGTGGEFDDQVAWVPATLLLNRLVAAGRLP
ncbi:hypothetical protein [Chitinimonas sp. BJYL2]|uniref:hypothetical protein n=1 Tax=Chitinimonas sp. BJYL2 TaxID=2976696 RepID=UPI0022B44DB1|nr:hypothetical protein [Chitinimonas sp. BJYL2]